MSSKHFNTYSHKSIGKKVQKCFYCVKHSDNFQNTRSTLSSCPTSLAALSKGLMGSWLPGLVRITRLAILVILTLFFTSRTQKRLLKDYRPYAEMVVIHLSCSVKFLKTLMVTLEYIWNSMLQLEGPVLLVKRLQICDSFKLKRFV